MTALPSRIGRFLAAQGWADATITPLAGDASARRYFRLTGAAGRAILADSPHPATDGVAFVAIGTALQRLGLSTPRILAAAAEAGLLVLEDFDDASFSRELDQGAAPAPLYRLAVDVLIALHQRFDSEMIPSLPLPLYDPADFAAQVALFADVCLPLLPAPPTPAAVADLAAAWAAVLPAATAVPQSLLLRDYHVGNLMLLPDRPGIAACGLLDFQNAGIGPVVYDLVSLLEDARRDVPDDLAAAMIDHYLAAFPALDRAGFAAAYAVLGAVRHLRVIAVFIRLAQRDGKPHYLVHLPRLWRLFDRQLTRPALAPVAAWFHHHLPPDCRAALTLLETVR